MVKSVSKEPSFVSQCGPTLVNSMTYTETIERMLARKLTAFEKLFANMNQSIVILHENFNSMKHCSAACKANGTQTNGEEASNKKLILEMQNQIAQLAAKQSELERKLASIAIEPLQDDAALNERFKAFSFTLDHLVNDTSQIKGEMSHLKEIVDSLPETKADGNDQRSPIFTFGASNSSTSTEASESVKADEDDAEIIFPEPPQSNDSSEADSQSQTSNVASSEEGKLLFENCAFKTGHEVEQQVLFNERGKIFHFVNGEWKERGTGNMQVLMEKETNAFRLLMKRDETLDVICNHAITEELQLEQFQDSNKTLTWFASDFSEQSEEDGLEEMFALKFKTEALSRQFEGTVKDCIGKFEVTQL